MSKLLMFILALIILAALHEGIHAVVALMYTELDGVHIRPLGLEVTYQTGVDERSGIQWAFISGSSNLITIFIGYLMLVTGKKFVRLNNVYLKLLIFYLTLLALLVDPFNCSIGPFIYGGDADGIAMGIGINRYVVQAVFLFMLLVNRELIVRKLFPIYKIQTRHILFRPLVKSSQ